MLLFRAAGFKGALRSSEEGAMEWVPRDRLSRIATVKDFGDLLAVMESPELSEFQYTVHGDEWTVSIK